MGLLTAGRALSWEDAQSHLQYIKEHGIIQFLNVMRLLGARTADCLKWGDEVEYIIVKHDPETKTVRLVTRAHEILHALEEYSLRNPAEDAVYHPEFGRFMLESTPGRPYGASIADFVRVEDNMRHRRRTMQAHLGPNEYIMTITAFQRMGVGHFLEPHVDPLGPVAQSIFVTDEAINVHPRFPTLVANIRKRRGANVAINVPLFVDERTREPRFVEEYQFCEEGPAVEKNGKWETPTGRPLTPLPAAAKPNHIYMDAMCFGMGCCCLQATFQAVNITEARDLYDQLNILAPIFMTLSAASPAFRGLLADVDCRWNVISASVDDRTPEELGQAPLTTPGRMVINKSRYDSIDCFLSQSPLMKDEYNDIDLLFDRQAYQTLRDGGIDERLARHVAHLWIRDPLVLTQGLIEEVHDEESMLHFENLQSTNWQTVRFKPPPPSSATEPASSSIGWRVEFRPMEVQTTDFENAAYSVVIVLLTRVILTYKINLYMPMSKVDENIANAQKRNAVHDQKFFFRSSILQTKGSCEPGTSDEVRLMTINEIVNGTDAFPGLLPLMHAYLDNLEVTVESRTRLNKYLDLIRMRASGELMTTATFVRRFITGHAAYKRDSVVSEAIQYDLVEALRDLANGTATAPQLLGNLAPFEPNARVITV